MSAQAQQQPISEAATRNGDFLPSLDQLFAETAALFHRLRAVVPLMHVHDDMNQDECAVLRAVAVEPGRTTTDIANDIGLPRNQAQKAVKSLEKRNLLDIQPSPENKRWKLLSLAGDGQTIVTALDRREIELLSRLPVDMSAEDLRAAAEALSKVRAALNDEQWRELLSG